MFNLFVWRFGRGKIYSLMFCCKKVYIFLYIFGFGNSLVFKSLGRWYDVVNFGLIWKELYIIGMEIGLNWFWGVFFRDDYLVIIKLFNVWEFCFLVGKFVLLWCDYGINLINGWWF